MSKLFSSTKIGPYQLSHRVVMAPLTRMRSDPGDIPSDLMVEYYSQRASKGGLIISEATPVSIRGYGYAGAPGIYSDRQIEGWRRVTDAVHAKGGRIFLQLWHVGRQSHTDLQPNGEPPVAPSAIAAEGYAYTRQGEVPFSMPRALALQEIPGIIEEFRAGAERALRAGFDGVEIHGANGYLPDQFLQDGTNKRTDGYGGPIENRARFLLEVTQAAISVGGVDRVGVRLTPSGTYGSMSDSDPAATFGYVAGRLDRLGIAYLHVVEPRIKGIEEIVKGQAPIAAQHLRQKFSRTLIAAGGFTGESAAAIVSAGDADLVAFGRYFISNPDLPERLRRNLPLTRYDRSTFYGGDGRGYIDYPTHAEMALLSADFVYVSLPSIGNHPSVAVTRVGDQITAALVHAAKGILRRTEPGQLAQTAGSPCGTPQRPSPTPRVSGGPMSQLTPRFVNAVPIDFLWEEAVVRPVLSGSRSRRSRATSTGGGEVRQAVTKAVLGDADTEAAGRWPLMMAAAQAGDRVAYEKLLCECIPVIQRVARRQGVQPGAIDDVVQEVLLTVHRARQTYDPARSFVAWLSTIAKRRAIDILRQRWRQCRREINTPVAYEMHSDPDSNPARGWEREGLTKTLAEAVAGLSSGQRQAVEHLALQEQPLAEASAATGRTVGALKVNLHRGLKSLQARLINRE